jgi:hypothetical protein
VSGKRNSPTVAARKQNAPKEIVTMVKRLTAPLILRVEIVYLRCGALSRTWRMATATKEARSASVSAISAVPGSPPPAARSRTAMLPVPSSCAAIIRGIVRPKQNAKQSDGYERKDESGRAKKELTHRRAAP